MINLLLLIKKKGELKRYFKQNIGTQFDFFLIGWRIQRE